MHIVGTWFESRAENGPYLLEIFSKNTGHLYWRFSAGTLAAFTGDFQSEHRHLYWRFSAGTLAAFTGDFQ
jgi:hypothetical protein